MNDEDPTTEQLRAIQADRADTEALEAVRAPTEEAQRAHERRADKAAYLRDRLDDQARSEREDA